MTTLFSSFSATAKTLISMATPVVAIAMVARNLFACDIIQDIFFSSVRGLLNRFSSQITMVITEADGLVNNQIYDAVRTYLGRKISPSTRRIKVTNPDPEQSFEIIMERDEIIFVDVFSSVKFKWVFQVESENSNNPRDLNSMMVRSLELSFHKKYRELVLTSYLPFIIGEAEFMKQEATAPRIFAVDFLRLDLRLNDVWMPAKIEHPVTFETLALEPDMKKFVQEDLERFVRRKEYYRKVGKPWKRGYLLSGPPGTGKSSLIAAMANYLHFDIYDLEFTRFLTSCDRELQKLLMNMAKRCILAVEDIDCTIEYQHRMAALCFPEPPLQTMPIVPMLLNFLDGVWSSCGDERIIVFTTNHKEKLDPAFLRPGRMDVHIHMSFCTPSMFRQLTFNYLQLHHHPLFSQIEEAILATHITPAEVAGQLLKIKSNNSNSNNSSDDHHFSVILQDLRQFLVQKKMENDKEIEAKERET
ncbi:protein HYPER-SENSITIVITY-RELATED 4-like [Neltuma alba]|uniref:protein HYPER-SENSITIVITY-RELATED 4-like n=1 Tax=Neltuma alba TaxID=207710 RepID=UPI0010A31802|nr:protein HYPER-SENSITIVITY-RELATED 4-like [Prosopis alba]